MAEFRLFLVCSSLSEREGRTREAGQSGKDTAFNLHKKGQSLGVTLNMGGRAPEEKNRTVPCCQATEQAGAAIRRLLGKENLFQGEERGLERFRLPKLVGCLRGGLGSLGGGGFGASPAESKKEL